MDQDSINKESIADSDNAIDGEVLAMQVGYPEIAPFIGRPGSTYMLSGNILDEHETRIAHELATTDRLWSAVMQDIAGYAQTEKTGMHPVATRDNSIAEAKFGVGEGHRSDKKSLVRTYLHRPMRAVLLGAFALVVVGAPLVYKSVKQDSSTSSELAHEMKVVSSAIGQKVTYHFPDGSSALLAPGTTIQYSSDFGVRNRDILLNGEALFTITQQSGKPFVVKTGEGDVRVLGTTFSVRHFDADKTATVVVAEGKISVSSEVLISGNSAVISRDGILQINRSTDISAALSWTTGRLEFKKARVGDVVSELERWLGLTIDVADKSILEQRLTGSFLLSEPDAALDNIASLLHLSVKRAGNHVSFTF